ncbi:MAG TPA: terminase family protein [Bryobacteraceae bacterium]|nr:terminase family protein [Bryobacteraceae bacterium]
MGKRISFARGTWENLTRREAVAGRVAVNEDFSDPVGLARRMGFEPDAIQERVLRSTARRGVLNCTRQWGKSTVSAAKAVHHALARPGALVIVGSPSARQSGEFLRKAQGMVRALGVEVRGDGFNELSILLANESRIVGLPQSEATTRGLSGATLLMIDEASRVEDSFYKSLRPLLSTTNGAVWLLSTPCEKRGFFYEAWEHGGDRWERVRVQATDCPRIHPEFLEEERSALGQAWFRQEYMAEFMDIGGGLFDRELVEAALTDELEPVDMGFCKR